MMRDDLTRIVMRRVVDGEFAHLPLRARVRRLAAEEAAFTDEALARFVDEVTASATGLGRLEPLLADPAVSEIMVNGPRDVYIERNGRIESAGVAFDDDAEVWALIERVVGPLGLRVDDSSPVVDARLADGSRFNAVLPPVARRGPCCNVRRFVLRVHSFADLVDRRFCSAKQAEYLAQAVRTRRSILVSGGTSTGKTTLLNVLASVIEPEERLITIEDAAELRLDHDHVVALESRPANIDGVGAVTIRDLVRNALRMRPDRIIVGEVRGGEAADMISAMTSGHEGSMCTIHANNPGDAIARIETMILTAEPAMPHTALGMLIDSAIDIIVQLCRDRDGARRIDHIHELNGGEVHDAD